jgi:tripartite-type tricarboxylate transporter receptor subunit TctC
MTTRSFLALLVLSILAIPAVAQTWPQRNVRLILPLGPGAGADIGARLIADRLARTWGQAVVVENRPGGDGVVAITTVLNANDDHIFLWGPSGAFVAHPYLHAKLPYDASQILPIARVSNTLVSVSVPTASGINSLGDFVAAAKKEPGKLNWAAVTGLNDFQFQAFARTAEISIVRVPYRDGVQALNDLAEGRIHAYSSAYAISRPQVQAGKIKVIALTNTARADVLAGVPTAREAGHPALEFDGLVGLYSTPVVPTGLRDRIASDVVEAMKDPVVIDRLTATGQVVNPGKSAEFAASIQHQRAGAAETAKVLGLKRAE